MAHALHIEGLRKSFGASSVLGPIDLHLAPGTITAVIGRSGCGKSTLLRCLGGLERPDHGTILIGTGELRREDVGYVFQEPRLMPWLDVASNVGFGLSGDKSSRQNAIREALEVVGLTNAAPLLPKQLSGGMAQRVALARSLAPKRELILLDEPFSALDPFTREQMQDHLRHLHTHYRTTMVLITHDMDEALALAHRIIVLRGPPGRIVADLTPGLAKPGDRTSPGFMEWKRRLSSLLMERAFVEEKAMVEGVSLEHLSACNRDYPPQASE